MTRGPDFVAIGAMKSATSTLHDQLAQQPGFHMSEPKEPNFFSDDEAYAGGIARYRALFSGAAASDLCGESSTHYTKLPTYPATVERMRRHIPDAKLIYVMRQPLQRLISHYIHEWTQNVIRGDLAVALREHPELVDYGRYSMQLRPFFDAYGPERVLPVFMERLIAHPQAELERICTFLGYTGEPRWVDDRAPQNVSSERLRESRLRDLIVEAPVLREIRKHLIPKRVRERVKALWRMDARPELTVADERRTREAFDADLATLGGWLGVELDCDSYRSTVTELVPQWTARTLAGDY